MQNKKRTKTDSEDDDDAEKEIPEEAGVVYDASEKGGRYEPTRTDPENDIVQIHSEKYLRVRTQNLILDVLTEMSINRMVR